MIEGPNVIEVATPRGHPTGGKGTVLIAGDDLPNGIRGRPVGQGINLHQKPTLRLDKKPPPNAPGGKGDLPDLTTGDGPVPPEFPRPVIEPHEHIERHGDMNNDGTAVSTRSPPGWAGDHQVVQRIGPLLIQRPPVIPVPDGVRLHGLLHHGGALGGQHGPEQGHPILLRIGQQLPLPHALLMPGFSSRRINAMNLPPHSGLSLPRGLLRHLLDEGLLDPPGNVRRQHGTLLGHGPGLLIRDLSISQQPQGDRMPTAQQPSGLQPLSRSGVGQLQGTGDLFHGTVPLTKKDGIHIGPHGWSHSRPLNPSRTIGVSGNHSQQLNLLGLQPGQMPLHHGERINPPTRRKPLTLQVIKSSRGLPTGPQLPQQRSPGIQFPHTRPTGAGNPTLNHHTHPLHQSPTPSPRARTPRTHPPHRASRSLNDPSLCVITPGRISNHKNKRNPAKAEPTAPHDTHSRTRACLPGRVRHPHRPKAADPTRRAGVTQLRPNPALAP